MGRTFEEDPPPAPESLRSPRRHFRQIALFWLLALSFLQYHALDVALQIYSLPSVIVFVPTARSAHG